MRASCFRRGAEWPAVLSREDSWNTVAVRRHVGINFLMSKTCINKVTGQGNIHEDELVSICHSSAVSRRKPRARDTARPKALICENGYHNVSWSGRESSQSAVQVRRDAAANAKARPPGRRLSFRGLSRREGWKAFQPGVKELGRMPDYVFCVVVECSHC